MMTILSGATVDIINFIPWGFTLLSVLVAIFSLVKNGAKDEKKEAKECAIDTTTVIVKLENLQNAMNRMNDSMASVQTKFEAFDHRLTVVEAQLKYSLTDTTKLDV